MNILQIFVSKIRHTIALSFASITILGIAISSSDAKTAILTSKNPTSEINLRLAPTTKSNAVNYGRHGDRIIIRNQAKGSDGYTWYFVKLEESNVTGWVRGDLIAKQNRYNNTQGQEEYYS